MVYKNLNLPATLIHTVDGKKYTLKGQLLSINESDKVCTMDFNGKVNENIPLNEVYLNEGVLDALKKVKAGAKKAWNKAINLIKKIGNFLLPVDEDGNAVLSFINNPVNIACMSLSPCISVVPSEMTLETCEMFGMTPKGVTLDEAFMTGEDKETKEANKIWGNIIKRYASTDDTIAESITYVKKNVLNEVVATLDSPVYTMKDDAVNTEESGVSLYGVTLSAKALKVEIKKSIMAQIKHKANAKPMLIWGAPGIGKTAIIKGAIKQIKKEKNMDLDLISINCGALRPDDWALPDTVKNKFGQEVAYQIPKVWMPVLNPGAYSTNEELQAAYKYYRSGQYRKMAHESISKDNSYIDKNKDNEERKRVDLEFDANDSSNKDGGIIFFDEVGRCATPDITFTMMTLLGDHLFGEDYVLAPGWATIGAANRLFDDSLGRKDKDFWRKWPQAVGDRWIVCTYVPTKLEWLDWARQPNEEGKRRIDSLIIDFISNMSDAVWYQALDLLNDEDADNVGASLAGSMKEIIKKIKAHEALSDEEADIFDRYYKEGAKSFVTCTGRTWDAKINSVFISDLEELFEDHPEVLENCYEGTEDVTYDDAGEPITYDVRELNYNRLGAALDLLPRHKWLVWANPIQDSMIRNGINFENGEENYIYNNRLAFIKKYLHWVIAMATGTKSIASTGYKNYLKSKAFTDKTVNSIWQNGYAKYLNADDWVDDIFEKHKTAYATDNENIAWKSDPTQIQKCIAKVAFKTKNIMTAQVRNEYAALQELCNKNGIDPKKPKVKLDRTEINKWLDNYTFDFVNNKGQVTKSVCALLPQGNVNGYDSLSPEEQQELQNAIFTLMHSKVARQLANVAMWVGKISIQCQSDTYIAAISSPNAGKDSSICVQSMFLHDVCKSNETIGQYHASNPHLSLVGPFQIISRILMEYNLQDF